MHHNSISKLRNKLRCITMLIVLLGIFQPVSAVYVTSNNKSDAKLESKLDDKDNKMTLNGSFEIDLTPMQDESNPAGRMLINKTYSGGLKGTGIGQMLSKRNQKGASAYAAVEEFSGTLEGKSGAFTLIHTGYMSAEHQSLEVMILEGSGTGELEGISGTMDITQDKSGHTYSLSYGYKTQAIKQ